MNSTASARDFEVVVFTKPAIPHRVKTRLIGELTAEQAAELHRAFVGDVLDELRRGSMELSIAWALASDEGVPNWPEAVGIEGFPQRGDGLGERLYHGLSRALRDRPMAAAIGSDHPELRWQTVADARQHLLDGADVVLGPSEDGGYYLVGVTRDGLQKRLFEDIDWSTERVLDQTLERAQELDARVELLPPGTDVDVAEDLHRLIDRIGSGEVSCPRTESVLRAWGRWTRQLG